MIIKKNIYMELLKREREILIYLPDDYETSNKHYPVMYINDGQNAFFDDQAYSGVSWGFLDWVRELNLDLILVAIPCNFEPGMRESEYGPWLTDRMVTIMETGKPFPYIGGEGELYVKFLKDQLKPYMDTTYRTIPEDTAIVGSSAGGNISAYASLCYPEVFKKCAALSSAIWYYPEQYKALIRSCDLSALECFYFDIGTNEGNEFVSNLYKYENAMMYEELMKKGVDERIHYAIYESAIHSEAEWRKRVPVFMKLFYN